LGHVRVRNRLAYRRPGAARRVLALSALQDVQLRLRKPTDKVASEWAERVGIWSRFSLLLELEQRCIRGQFSSALADSVRSSLTRECTRLVSIPGWKGEA
jgi:hypothetical protein